MVYAHGILQSKRRKSLGVQLWCLRVSTQRISQGLVFWELPRPLRGITDGGAAEMMDNHHAKKKKKKDLRRTELKRKNKMCSLAAYRQWDGWSCHRPPHPIGLMWSAWGEKILFPSHQPGCCDLWKLNPLVHWATERRSNLCKSSSNEQGWAGSRTEQNPQINT